MEDDKKEELQALKEWQDYFNNLGIMIEKCRYVEVYMNLQEIKNDYSKRIIMLEGICNFDYLN